MKDAKVYKIKWRDAYSINGWHEDLAASDKDDIVETVGFFLRESKLYFFLYQSISKFGTVNEVIAIPHQNIISKEELK